MGTSLLPPPQVTVVIPTFNRRDVLTEAIRSVQSQEGPPFEILVVDDGSTDGTEALVRDWCRREARLRYVRQDNAGPSAARNRGVAGARGPLTAFLDSDDLYLPGNLRSQAALLEAHPDADLVTCDVRFEGAWKRRAGMTMFQRPGWLDPRSLDAVSRGASIAPTSVMLRTEAARALPFDEDLVWFEDVDFLFRFHASGRRLLVNREVLAVWRQVPHGGAPRLSSSGPAEALDARIAVMMRHVGLAPDPGAARLFLHRLQAKAHIRAGRWRRARAHLWACWRRRPYELHTLRKLLRSLLARRH